VFLVESVMIGESGIARFVISVLMGFHFLARGVGGVRILMLICNAWVHCEGRGDASSTCAESVFEIRKLSYLTVLATQT
jgi:hypothetical protein